MITETKESIQTIADELKNLLTTEGAALVGYGDLHEVPYIDRAGMPVGVSVAVVYPRGTIEGIANGPTHEYHAMYNALNERKDRIIATGAEYLKSKGYNAIAQTSAYVNYKEGDISSVLPYKTVGTRAGLGWIGKCALLVTKQYGSMVRLSSILTDAPLPCAEPINESSCGSCNACVDECPGHAVVGVNWSLGKDREEFFHAVACRQKARELSDRLLNERVTLCGKCILVCPYTQKYLNGGNQCE